MRSRRLSVEPSQTGHPGFRHRGANRAICLRGNRAVGVHKIRRVEVQRIDLGTRHKGRQVDRVRTLDIERLQLFRREGDELAALVFVALAHLVAVDLVARMRIVRPERDTGGGSRVFRLVFRLAG
jgi:hypothetical protein